MTTSDFSHIDQSYKLVHWKCSVYGEWFGLIAPPPATVALLTNILMRSDKRPANVNGEEQIGLRAGSSLMLFIYYYIVVVFIYFSTKCVTTLDEHSPGSEISSLFAFVLFMQSIKTI